MPRPSVADSPGGTPAPAGTSCSDTPPRGGVNFTAFDSRLQTIRPCSRDPGRTGTPPAPRGSISVCHCRTWARVMAAGRTPFRARLSETRAEIRRVRISQSELHSDDARQVRRSASDEPCSAPAGDSARSRRRRVKVRSDGSSPWMPAGGPSRARRRAASGVVRQRAEEPVLQPVGPGQRLLRSSSAA